MANSKKQTTEKVPQVGFTLSLKSANSADYPLVYQSDVWDVAQEDTELGYLLGGSGQYDQHTINEELAKAAGDQVFQPEYAPFSAKQKHRNSINSIPVETKLISESAISIGAGHTVGLKSYRWTAIDFEGKVVTFETEPVGWSVGDVITLVNDTKYENCATITAIDGVNVTLNGIPFSGIVDEHEYDSKTACVLEKPDVGNIDIGIAAVAEGIFNKSLNLASHAEGFNTEAIGQYSHSEGRDTISWYGSHSEGWGTQALGHESHSEGKDTLAKGIRSHSEGDTTKAYGWRSHVEGNRTITGNINNSDLGASAHAEGEYTIAEGNYSHAEGWDTLARNTGSHAEGRRTTADGYNSHVEGGYVNNDHGKLILTSTEDPVVYEYTCVSSGQPVVGTTTQNGVEIVSFEASSSTEGTVTLSETVGSKNAAEVFFGSHAKGAASHAEGGKTVAAGGASHAEGQNTTATGDRSHAEGMATKAAGASSHAEGSNTVAAGASAHVEGDSTMASGNFSHAEGWETLASSTGSHAEGRRTTASGINSHAEGGYMEDAHGKLVLTSTDNPVVYAYACESWAQPVVGSTTKNGIEIVEFTANGNTSGMVTLSETLGDKAGENVFFGSSAKGGASHAEGSKTVAVGKASHTEGMEARTEGNYSHAEGQRTKAIGTASHAEGIGTEATNANEHAVGRYNKSNKASGSYGNAGNTTYSIGIGSSSAKKNAVEVMENGKVYVKGVGNYDGTNPTASGVKDVATVINANISVQGVILDQGKLQVDVVGSDRIARIPTAFSVGAGTDSAVQRQSSDTVIGLSVGPNSAISPNSVVEGGGNFAGLKGYRYTNTGSVTNSLTFEVTPDGWAVGDVVSIINKDKYSDIATIESIDGNVVTFTEPLNIGTEFIDESDFDSKCAYVSAKPTIGNVDLGAGSHAEGFRTRAINTVAHAEGRDTVASGQYSHAEGRGTSAKNYIAHAEGHDTVAKGMTSHAEGYKTTAGGNNSHSEGRETETSGANSHAENYHTAAFGENSHAEGAQSRTGGIAKPTPVTVFTNTGYAAHAEGNGAWATGSSSHAEGYSTLASALAAHAEGNQTVASGQNSHASGLKSIAEGYASIAMGRSAHALHDRSFVWQGLDTDAQYHSHNIGSININPAPAKGSTDPATGFWIGEKTLAQLLTEASPAITQVNADWNATNGVAQILNKPTIPTTASDIGALEAAPLAGKTYDCSTNAGYYRAIEDIVRALGGTITNSQLPPAN